MCCACVRASVRACERKSVRACVRTRACVCVACVPDGVHVSECVLAFTYLATLGIRRPSVAVPFPRSSLCRTCPPVSCCSCNVTINIRVVSVEIMAIREESHVVKCF